MGVPAQGGNRLPPTAVATGRPEKPRHPQHGIPSALGESVRDFGLLDQEHFLWVVLSFAYFFYFYRLKIRGLLFWDGDR
jgi:hypothetical protein